MSHVTLSLSTEHSIREREGERKREDERGCDLNSTVYLSTVVIVLHHPHTYG